MTTIVLSVSGNDLGFGDVIKQCAEAFADPLNVLKTPCRDNQQSAIMQALPAAMTGLRGALQDIRDAMRYQGYSVNDYRLIAQGYPNLLPPSYRVYSSSDRFNNGCPFFGSDADWTRDWVLPTFAKSIRTEAARAGAQFVDMQSLFLGHELCSTQSSRVGVFGPNSINEMEWIHMMSATLIGSWNDAQQEESMHPNAYGHQIMAKCIGQVYSQAARTDFECRSDAHTSTVTVSPLAMLNNGSFDGALGPMWDVWHPSNIDQYRPSIVTGPSHTGSAVRIPAGPASVYQTIAVLPNWTYSVSGWGMVDIANGTLQSGATDFFGPADGCSNVGVSFDTTAYTNKQFVFTTGATNVTATIFCSRRGPPTTATATTSP